MIELRSMVKRGVRYCLISLGRLVQKAQLAREEHRSDGLRRRLSCIGHGGHMHRQIFISDPQSVAIGNNVVLEEGCYIDALGGLQIHDNCFLSRCVTIFCSDYECTPELGPPAPARALWQGVVIEKNVWIGMNVCILPGVRIGEGAIIGFGAVIAKDVPPFSVVERYPPHSGGTIDRLGHRAQNGHGFSPRAACPAASTYKPTGRTHRPNITFVVTTGRSGSTSLARIFENQNCVIARHEPRRQMIKLSTDYAHGIIGYGQLVSQLEELFLDGTVYSADTIHLESDQKYFNMIPALATIFPEAKFVWLVRSAEAVVSSIVGRGWYASDNHPVYNKIPAYWHAFRVQGDSVRDGPGEQWHAMSSFEKCCWYWGYVNATIERDLRMISSEAKITVKLEQLSQQLFHLLDFLNVSHLPLRTTVSNAAFHNRYDKRGWSQDEKQAFERWCRPLMDAYYPGV